MRFPDFDLERAGEGSGRLRAVDLAGRPWIGYLARHPGCNVCQHSLRGLVSERDRIRELDGELIVFLNADIGTVSKWFARSGLPADLPVVADPGATIYESLGTSRRNLVTVFGGRTIPEIVRAYRAGYRVRFTFGADMFRLGADVVVDHGGNITFRYLSENPADRATPEQLVRELHALRYRKDRRSDPVPQPAPAQRRATVPSAEGVPLTYFPW